MHTVYQLFILRTSNVNHVKAMSIKLNTNNSNITVYDDARLKHANSKEIVSLMSFTGGNLKLKIANLISDSLNLIDSERELYIAITSYLDHVNSNLQSNSDTVDLYYINNRCVEMNGKSYITYRRASEVLVRKGIIKYTDSYRAVTINPEYNIGVLTNTAKYIVIEL